MAGYNFESAPTGEVFEGELVYRVKCPLKDLEKLCYGLFGAPRFVNGPNWATHINKYIFIPDFSPTPLKFLFHRISSGMLEYVLLFDDAPREGWVSPPANEAVGELFPVNQLVTSSGQFFETASGEVFLTAD